MRAFFPVGIGFLGVLAALAVGCGGEEPLDRQGLIAAADEACAESNRAFEDAGPRGITNEGVAAEVATTVRLYDERIATLEDLQVAEALRPTWNRYLAGERAKKAGFQEVVRAARADDDAGVGAGFDSASKAGESRDEAARELGFDVCGVPAEVRTEATGTGPSDDLVYVRPTNDIESAIREFSRVAATGDCAATNELFHTDAGGFSPEECPNVPYYFDGSRVVATEEYGPVGVAETVASDGTHVVNVFAVDISGDRKLRKITDLIHDSGGLRPAPEDNDAEQIAAETVAAIRDGDAKALNRVTDYPDSDGSFDVLADGFSTFGSGKFGKGLVASVRGGEAEPKLLGINAAYALYFLEGDEYDYVLTFTASAGNGSKYRFSGFYPIPKPR